MAKKKNESSDDSRARGGFKASRHGDGKAKASAAGNKSEQQRAAHRHLPQHVRDAAALVEGAR